MSFGLPHCDSEQSRIKTLGVLGHSLSCLSIHPSICPSIRLFFCLSVHPSVCPSIHLSVCQQFRFYAINRPNCLKRGGKILWSYITLCRTHLRTGKSAWFVVIFVDMHWKTSWLPPEMLISWNLFGSFSASFCLSLSFILSFLSFFLSFFLFFFHSFFHLFLSSIAFACMRV